MKKLGEKFILTLICATSINVLFAKDVTIDSSVTFNTNDGWEATPVWDNVASDGFYTSKLEPFQDEIADVAVNQLGLNRIRLEIDSGNENPIDYWDLFYKGQITRATLKEHLYQKINDNADPNVTNSNGFHFTYLDYQMDHIVMPMIQKLAARGETLYISLCLVDFNNGTNGNLSDMSLADSPDEYAELIEETFKHLQIKYGITPDALEIVLEPDNSPDWRGAGIGTRIGNNMVAAMSRLNNNGFTVSEVIAPSTLSSTIAISAFDEMYQIPEVQGLLTTLSYHKYAGNQNTNRPLILARAETNGLKTAMLEHFTDTHRDLMDDLQQAHISSYQRWAYAAPHFSTYINTDVTNPSQPSFTLHDQVRAIPQVFKYVRLGAVQIDVPTGNAVAYINTNNDYSVIMGNTTFGPHNIIGLPSGSYGVTSSGLDAGNSYLMEASSADVTITNGETLTFNALTTGGLITVFSKSSNVTPTNQPPVANNDSATTAFETTISIAILANDADVDGTIDVGSANIITNVSNGTTSVSSTTGEVTYTPNTGFSGEDSFTYTVNDDLASTSNIATVSITVSAQVITPNLPPVVNNDSIVTNFDTAIVINILNNDTDTDGTIDPGTVVIGTSPQNGVATVETDGQVTYTPTAGFSGSDSFTYTVMDNNGDISNLASVSITVNPMPQPVQESSGGGGSIFWLLYFLGLRSFCKRNSRWTQVFDKGLK